MDKKICIVTPDIVGPMKNGGIGTHCYWLARFLARSGYRTSVLYTGVFAAGSVEEVKAQYAQHQVEFIALSEVSRSPCPNYGMEGPGIVSDQALAYLRTCSFDVIHFQDWQGHGFASIQAKRLGSAFADTQLVVAIHSPTLWSREAMQLWAGSPVNDAKLDYMEKYSIEHADAVWAPSEAMYRWIESRGYRMPESRTLVRYLIRVDPTPDGETPDYHAKDPSHLVFFGRLETRKGLELFVESVQSILDSGKDHGIKRVTFMGKVGTVLNGMNALYYLKRALEGWADRGITVKVVDDFDAFQAIRFIKKVGAIAIMPSLLDNYPYAVLECLENQIPFLTSSIGGMPEMASAEAIFEATTSSLVQAILNRVERTSKVRNLYSSNQTQRDWLKYTEALCGAPNPPLTVEKPPVSVCITYYNYGKYLPQLLASLAQNDYPNFEVVVVDDGSTDPHSVEVFAAQKKEYASRGWRFLTKPNGGICEARNFAAKQARSEYIIFMDADNVAKPHMISTLMTAIVKTKLDAVTCTAQAFTGEAMPDENTPVTYLYRPIGPLLEVGMLENIFGDTNSCVRREVFEAIGGFNTDGVPTHDDWELWALLCLKGYTLDVIPEPIFYYRYHEKGYSKRTNWVINHKAVLRTYYKFPEKLSLEYLAEKLLVPFHYQRKPSKAKDE